jgi:hypothetical protein
MPKNVPTTDASSDLSLSPPSGCTINRFSATKPPGPDGDAGAITISGWNQHTIGVSAVTGTAASGNTMYPITCNRGGALMDYSCGFGGMANSDGGGMGMTTDSVIFPLIKHRVVDHMTGGTIINVALPDWPAAFNDACIERTCAQNIMPAPSPACAGLGGCDVVCCEQSPLALGTSNITEAIAGGTDYIAGTNMLGHKDDSDAGVTEFPQPVYLVSVTQTGSTTSLAGTDPFTGGPSLTMADGAIDVTKALTLSFSCDGSGTVGSGCTGSSDLVALLVKTSTSKRIAFGSSTATGSAQCISTLPAGTLTIKAAQLAALVGTQTGGSFQLALARLRLIAAANGSHTVVYSGGMGVFGFTNQ